MNLRIGDLQLSSNLLLAPIAGYTDQAFRLVARECGGVGLAFTDLTNPQSLLRDTPRLRELAGPRPADSPLGLQLYGGDADDLVRAARTAQDHGVSLIDLNLGCPARKITKRSGGAGLLRDPERATDIVRRLVRAVRIPVTAKLRLGWDDDSIVAPGLAADLESVGAAAVTVHGRTAAQKFSGGVRLEEIARVVESVRRIPVIGNGDVRSPADAAEMIRRTGCAGVMIGRGALGHPWIFRETDALLSGRETPQSPTRTERIDLLERHFGLLLEDLGERRACIAFRQRISWYARRLRPCPGLHEAMRNLSAAEQFFHAVQELRRSATVDDFQVRSGETPKGVLRPVG